MKKKNNILIFTATYNESENIKKLIININKNNNIDILVIDDSSPDQTFKILVKLKKKYRNIKLIKRKKKLGLDTAHKYAFNYARKNKYKKFITLDADLSHDPFKIKKFIKLLDKNEFVIGSRYMRGGKCLMKKNRFLVSKYGNLLIKFIFNTHCSEFTTSYRGFNMEKLKRFNLNLVRATGYSFFMVTIIELIRLGYKITETPIIFRDRLHGKSKIEKIELLRTIYYLIYLKLKKH